MAASSGGSNFIRGGVRKFGPKTKCGNWVELNKEPGQALPPGFPHVMYLSDAHQQMAGGRLLKPTKYGAGLPPAGDPRIDYGRVLNYDKREGDSRWAALSKTAFASPTVGTHRDTEFASTFKLIGGIGDHEELRRYRARWTMEGDALRSVRFKTDAVISANAGVPRRFQLKQTRPFPGTPKAVDRLRATVLARGRYGLVELRDALFHSCSSSDARSLAPPVLVEALKGMGSPSLAEADAEKAISFFANEGQVGASVCDLLMAIRGPVNERRRAAMSKAFQMLDVARKGFMEREDVQHHCDASSEFPKGSEVRNALLDHWRLYQDGGRVYMSGFEHFLGDISCGVDSDDEFEKLIATLFKTELKHDWTDDHGP